MRIITVESLVKLINLHGFESFMKDLILYLKRDFSRWDKFTIIPRPGMYVQNGVMELMPICDNGKFFTFKYVNLHPGNPKIGKQTVVATGQLVDIKTGYPLMYSEMTLLTALRTAATSALVADLLACKKAQVLGLIGTGAQSEFQISAMKLVRDIGEIRYFDIDGKAMDKLEKNLQNTNLRQIRCRNAAETTYGADIITVCTANYGHFEILKKKWIRPGVHINAIGGDSKGKTELEKGILPISKIVIEYFDQTKDEGEIQVLKKDLAKKLVHAELHELVKGLKIGRTNNKEITLFDSVGIAMEDYSALRLVYELSNKYKIGQELNIIPKLDNPKNLYEVLS